MTDSSGSYAYENMDAQGKRNHSPTQSEGAPHPYIRISHAYTPRKKRYLTEYDYI